MLGPRSPRAFTCMHDSYTRRKPLHALRLEPLEAVSKQRHVEGHLLYMRVVAKEADGVGWWTGGRL
jgi:hypothetical protein